MKPSRHTSPLWDFSLELYRQPGVESLCLTLQEQWQANVNLLLWLRWLETQSLPIDDARLDLAAKHIADWHWDVVVPLRCLRKQIKARYGVEEEPIETSRSAIKKAELEAERVVQRRLEVLAGSWLAEEGRRSVDPGTNLIVYTRKLCVPPALAREVQQRLCGVP